MRGLSLSGVVQLLGVGFALIVLSFVVVPLIVLVLSGFLSDPLAAGGRLTLDNYRAILADTKHQLPYLRDTFEYVLGGSVVAVGIGALFAWAVTSVKLPGRAVLRLLPLGPLVLPGLLKDPGAVELYSPRGGLANIFLMNTFGLHHPVFNVYTMTGMIIIGGVNLVSIPYLILLAPFGSLDRSLEEASRSSGASAWRTIRRVVIPLLIPAMLSAISVTALIFAASFETPVIIGVPGGVDTYMAVIYRAMSITQNYQLASAESSIYLIISCLLLAWYLAATRHERRFVSVTGRGHLHALTSVPAWIRFLLTAAILIFFLVVVVLPLILNFLIALVPYYTTTAGNPFAHLTLDNYRTLFADNAVVKTVISSAVIAAEVSVGALIAAGILALVALKSRIRGRRYAEAVGTFPIAMPAMVFSVTILITFLSVPGLGWAYLTPIPIVVGEIVVFMPYALRVISSALIQVHDELLEASQLSGASRLRTGVSIVTPLLAVSLVNAFAIVFALSYRELGAAVLLVTPNTDLVPVLTFGLWNDGGLPAVAALNMVTLLLPLVVVVTAFAATSAWRRLHRITAKRRISELGLLVPALARVR